MTCRMKLGICDGDEPHGEEARKKYRPHPEELAKQASRRMDTTHGLAAILRDARKGALLRMRSEIYSHALSRGRRSGKIHPFAGSAWAKLQEWPNGSMMRA